MTMLAFERFSVPAMVARRPSVGLRDLYRSVAHLEIFYPQFEPWFWGKVVGGLADGSRQILAACSDDSLIGLAILKRERTERKICTLWVRPSGRHEGVGTQLMTQAFAWLECDKPLITVCQERLDELSPLLRKFDFRLEQVCDSYYRPTRREYVFNGLALAEKDIFQALHAPALDFKEGAATALGLAARRLDF